MFKKIWSILSMAMIAVLLVTAIGAATTTPAYAASETNGPDWDRSSLSVSGTCSGGLATFTVTNVGDRGMAGTTSYTWSDEGGNSGSGTIPALASGQSYTFSISGVGKVSVVVFQRPGHPGTGRAKADAGPCAPPPPPQYASASVNVPSGCIAEGTTVSVSFAVSHATLTLDGQSYSNDGSVNLGAGNHSWSAVADNGYTMLGDSSGSFTITTCAPPPPPQYASASVNVPSGCIAEGTTVSVSFAVSHATLTLDGVSYTSSGSVNLGAGNHSWSAVADNGYTMQGDASGSFTITTCETPPPPGQGKVSIDPICQNGVTPGISVSITNAILTIGGNTYTQSGFIPLNPGTYAYSWTAAEGYTGSGQGTAVVLVDCNEIPRLVRLWKPECKNNCKAARWETEAGPVTWQSNDLLGKGKPGILWATVNVNCDPSNGHGCNYHTMILGSSSVSGYTVIVRGVKYHSFENVGADGKTYNLFVGFTDTCWDKASTGSKIDDCAAGKPNITLPNGWTAVNMPQDYYQVIPDKDVPIYWEWPCSLSPSYAWTTSGGQAINFPGTTSNDWIIWQMKAGIRPWPKTWPTNPLLGWWIWGREPMKTTRAWATELLHSDTWSTLAFPTK